MIQTSRPAPWASDRQPIRCVIDCQQGIQYTADLSLGQTRDQKDFSLSIDEQDAGGCRLGTIRLQLRGEPHAGCPSLTAQAPVKLWVQPARKPSRMTALYLYNPWWTRPAFAAGFAEIPSRTQVLLLQYPDAFGCLVPMVGRQFKAWAAPGTETELALEMGCGTAGLRQAEEPLYLYAQGTDLFETIHRAFAWLAEEKGLRLRQDRRLSEPFRYLGWCSWDAFYREVSEAGILQKAEELRAKKVPVRWFVIDDGWLQTRDDQLLSLRPDPAKVPRGFKPLVQELKQDFSIDWVGVWHALAGFWGGIAPDGEAAAREAGALCRTAGGTLVPSPATGERFYRDWYDLLRREGISFVKVDGQSSTANYFENTLPAAEAAAGLGRALEDGAAGMDGALLNCMGMAMKNLLARPVSALSRNSDDFLPQKPEHFAEHLLQNAYNALYHNQLYVCDWDMFWTSHPDAPKHALLRAVSGGPVYVSDPVGQTDPAILKPLACLDGRLLQMSRSAMPTADCVFSNPLHAGVLKLHNIAPCGQGGTAGGLAVFNLTHVTRHFVFSPGDVPELDKNASYWVYDFFAQKACLLDGGRDCQGNLAPGSYGWFILLPSKGPAAFLGLVDKYVGFAAVESVWADGAAACAILRESGRMGWLAEQPPRKVCLNGTEVTDQVKARENLYILDCPEGSDKALLSLQW